MSWYYYPEPGCEDACRPSLQNGRALILLHGIGMSHLAWEPVIHILAKERCVYAFDIPGFGRTPPLVGIQPTPDNLVNSLVETLKDIGITSPVDIAGNSLGGRLSLEAAKRGPGLVRSVVAISPAGLWKNHPPAHAKPVLRLTRWGTHCPLLRRSLRFAAIRTVLMAIPVSVNSWRIPGERAVAIAETFDSATAFDETLESLGEPFRDGRAISESIPVTIAFGTRDWLLTRSARLCHEIPEHTHWVYKPGWGHVPMWDAPECVAQLINEGTK